MFTILFIFEDRSEEWYDVNTDESDAWSLDQYWFETKNHYS